MLEDSIRAWNPWWAREGVPAELVGTPRSRLPDLVSAMDLRHVKDVLGVRRAGKTTLLHQLVDHLVADGVPPADIALLNFDDPVIHGTDLGELVDGLQTIHPGVSHLLLDEVQERDGWERWVRTLYDTRAFEQIIVTGSSTSLLEGALARVLSGRHLTVRLFPFSFEEYLRHQGWAAFSEDELASEKGTVLHHLMNYLEAGGFPEVAGLPPDQRKRVLTQFFHDIVARDVVGRHGAEPALASKLASVLLANSGSPFTYRRLANATGMSTDTVSKYTGYLTEAFLFQELPPYSHKVQERYRGPRKFYAIDPGLVYTVAARTSPDRGWALENAVVLELMRRGVEVHHWRDQRQREVDVLTATGGAIERALQVSYRVDDPRTRERELEALDAAMQEFDLPEGTLITWDQQGETEVEAGRVEIVPLWRFLLLSGGSAEQ